jgi:hypothetical protein
MSGRHQRQGSLAEPSRYERQDSLLERRGSLPQLKTSGAVNAPPPSSHKRLSVTSRDAHLGMQLQVPEPNIAPDRSHHACVHEVDCCEYAIDTVRAIYRGSRPC